MEGSAKRRRLLPPRPTEWHAVPDEQWYHISLFLEMKEVFCLMVCHPIFRRLLPSRAHGNKSWVMPQRTDNSFAIDWKRTRHIWQTFPLAVFARAPTDICVLPEHASHILSLPIRSRRITIGAAVIADYAPVLDLPLRPCPPLEDLYLRCCEDVTGWELPPSFGHGLQVRHLQLYDKDEDSLLTTQLLQRVQGLESFEMLSEREDAWRALLSHAPTLRKLELYRDIPTSLLPQWRQTRFPLLEEFHARSCQDQGCILPTLGQGRLKHLEASKASIDLGDNKSVQVDALRSGLDGIAMHANGLRSGLEGIAMHRLAQQLQIPGLTIDSLHLPAGMTQHVWHLLSQHQQLESIRIVQDRFATIPRPESEWSVLRSSGGFEFDNAELSELLAFIQAHPAPGPIVGLGTLRVKQLNDMLRDSEIHELPIRCVELLSSQVPLCAPASGFAGGGRRSKWSLVPLPFPRVQKVVLHEDWPKDRAEELQLWFPAATISRHVEK